MYCYCYITINSHILITNISSRTHVLSNNFSIACPYIIHTIYIRNLKLSQIKKVMYNVSFKTKCFPF